MEFDSDEFDQDRYEYGMAVFKMSPLASELLYDVRVRLANKDKEMILPCNCKNEGQDKLNGKGKRVANPLDSRDPIYRCTVCGATLTGTKKERK